jgi:hypothetical protein
VKKIPERITIKNIENRLKNINKNLALHRVKRRLALGQRYNRKYIDVYNTKGDQVGYALTSGRTGEVYEYLGGFQKSLHMINDAKYQRARKAKARKSKKKK